MTCRKRKTRCAGEKPVCSTCTNNGHLCLGYPDEKRRESGGYGGSVLVKREPIGTVDDDCSSEDEEELEHRPWKSQPAVPPMAGFVDHDALSRHDSTSSATVTPGRPREPSNDWDQDDKSPGSATANKRSNYARNASYSEGSRSSNNRSPVQHHTESHRMPYFRYFGPTAIVPGYKRMLGNVYRKSRGSSFSTASPGSVFGYGMSQIHLSHHETPLETLEDLPVYDPNGSGPIHPLIISLVDTFFHHLGCNYLFLRQDRFVRLLKEKRLEPILVDAVCALAARFSEHPIFTNAHDGKTRRSEYGQVFAQRAKGAIVDTFAYPSVAAIQASLLMAYEGFGANQDSALWMYLGIAIRMVLDLGLQKMVGVKYQGERDPWYTRYLSRTTSDETDGPEAKQSDDDTPSPAEQLEVEQERIDTFWAVFVLDRVISSGTGRPVTFRDDDFDLSLPEPSIDPATGWPAPFPTFSEIIHLYGRVSDVLNYIRDANDLTEEKMASLAQMESDLTAIYKKQDHRLHFNAVNFREYIKANQGTTFILLHFWFHALIIVLHQPTLLTLFHNLRPTQLLPNSRELSMSSAKTIADILAFAELIDPNCFVGNPFTSQPIYIAACAFLMESVANTSAPPSRTTSPSPDVKSESLRSFSGRFGSSSEVRPTKHSLLASAANQNYQRCYKALQHLEQFWGGVGYILTALDQKSKGIWDCETFTNEEYEAIKLSRRTSLSRLPRLEHPASPSVPAIAYSLTGTTNSPNTNLTVVYQSSITPQAGAHALPSTTPLPPPPPPPPVSAATPPGNMIYDPIRQSLPEPSPTFPPAYLQPNVSAVRYQTHTAKGGRTSQSPAMGKTFLKYESTPPADLGTSSPRNDPRSHMQHHGVMSHSSHGALTHPSYTPSPQQQSGYDSSMSSTPTDSGMGQHLSYGQQNHNHNHNHVHNHNHGQNHDHSHNHQQNHNHDSCIDHNDKYNNNNNNNNNSSNNSNNNNGYEADFAQSGLVSGSYSYIGLNPINDVNVITFNSADVNFDNLGLQSEMMPPEAPWLEILPEVVLGGLFEGPMTGVAGVMQMQGHMG